MSSFYRARMRTNRSPVATDHGGPSDPRLPIDASIATGASTATIPCQLSAISEHLLSFGLPIGTIAPGDLAPGTIVDITIGTRSYRSTVQHADEHTFSVLRPRDLDDLRASFVLSADGLVG
jgi:hypothetical protein